MIAYLVVLAIGLYFLYMSSKKRAEIIKFAKDIGGPKGYPVLGNALEFVRDMSGTLDTLTKYVKEHGDRFVFFFGPTPVLLINNVEDIEKVCSSNELIVKSEEYEYLWDWMGKTNLLLSTGAHWQHRRKQLTPCFFFTILEKFVDPINAHAQTLTDILSEKFTGQKEFHDISPYVAKCAVDIICETSMGIQMDSKNKEGAAYVQAVNRLGVLFQHRMVRPWLRPAFIWNLTRSRVEEKQIHKFIHGFVDKVIADRKMAMASKSNNVSSNGDVARDELVGRKVAKPLLDLMLEIQRDNVDGGISDECIREESNTFIFAGHDTVTATISICLYNLGNHPDIQEKVHQELDSVLGGDPTKYVTSTIIKNLKYLELCLKESMRLFASVPLIGRNVHKPFRLDDKTVVPPGVILYISPYLIHRNAKYFRDPTKFIPERFDLDNPEFAEDRAKSPFAYIPFSAGSRNCIGQKMALLEAKVVLATILRKFRVKSEKRGEELKVRSELVMRFREGLKVKLEERMQS